VENGGGHAAAETAWAAVGCMQVDVVGRGDAAPPYHRFNRHSSCDRWSNLTRQGGRHPHTRQTGYSGGSPARPGTPSCRSSRLAASKRYSPPPLEPRRALPPLRGIDLAIEAGEFVAITGASGSGKSTLLHMLGGITRPTSGSVLLEGVESGGLDDDALAIVRRRRIGFVFQRDNLLPELSLVENVGVAARARWPPAAGEPRGGRLEAAGRPVGHGRAGHAPPWTPSPAGSGQPRGDRPARLTCGRRSSACAADGRRRPQLDSSISASASWKLVQELVAGRGQTVVLVRARCGGGGARQGRIVRVRDGLGGIRFAACGRRRSS